MEQVQVQAKKPIHRPGLGSDPAVAKQVQGDDKMGPRSNKEVSPQIEVWIKKLYGQAGTTAPLTLLQKRLKAQGWA